MARYTVYTDGSCLGNPGRGGIGVVVRDSNRQVVKEISEGYEFTTNNRMELLAAIRGMEAVEDNSDIILHSDSIYLIKNATNRNALKRWKTNGWILASGKPVANKDLWERIDQLLSLKQVQFVKVKGHAGVEDNERCDELARSAAGGTVLLSDTISEDKYPLPDELSKRVLGSTDVLFNLLGDRWMMVIDSLVEILTTHGRNGYIFYDNESNGSEYYFMYCNKQMEPTLRINRFIRYCGDPLLYLILVKGIKDNTTDGIATLVRDKVEEELNKVTFSSVLSNVVVSKPIIRDYICFGILSTLPDHDTGKFILSKIVSKSDDELINVSEHGPNHFMNSRIVVNENREYTIFGLTLVIFSTLELISRHIMDFRKYHELN